MLEFEKSLRWYERHVIGIHEFFFPACQHATKENVEQIYGQIFDDDRYEFCRCVAYQPFDAEVMIMGMGHGKVTRLDKSFYQGLNAFREYLGPFQFGDHLLMEKLWLDYNLSRLHLGDDIIDQTKERAKLTAEKLLIEKLLETHEPVMLKKILSP